NRRQEMHFNFYQAIAFTFLAATTFDVETEPSRVVATDASGGEARKQIANGIEHASVGRGIASRRAANRRLIDDDDFVEAFETLESPMRAGAFLGAKKFPEQCAAQNVID